MSGLLIIAFLLGWFGKKYQAKWVPNVKEAFKSLRNKL